MQERVIIPFIIEFENYVKRHKKSIWESAFAKYKNAYQEIKGLFTEKLTRKAMEECVFSVAERLEEAIKETAEKHSRLFWLQIYRKVNPDAFNGIPKQIMPSTICLVLRTVDCFIIKYGKNERTDVLSIGDLLTPVFDVAFSGYEMGLLFYMCYIYNNLTALYRCMSKGCTVILGESDFESDIDEETRHLMRLIDARREKYGNPIHNLCTSEYSRNQIHLEEIDPKNMVKMIFESRAVVNKPNDYQFNYLISPFYIEDVIKYTRFWSEMNIKVNGFMPNEIIALLAAMTRSRIEFCGYDKTKFIQSFCMNGFITIHTKKEDPSPKQFIHDNIQIYFSEYYESIFGQSITKERADDLIARFILQYSKCNEIQPFSKTRLPIFIECGDTVIINLVNLLLNLAYWTSSLNESQEVGVGTNRGQLFQEEVRRVLSRNMNETIRFYPEMSERIYLNGKLCGEIDIGIRKDDILYVIECKHKLSYEDNIVETVEYVNNMNTLQKKWLNQVDTLAINLRNGATLKNGTRLCNDEIKYIVPLVCTAVPYYTSSTNHDYYIAEDFPRVLTPQELVSVIHMPIEKLLLQPDNII